jgi:hypothetical protein
MSYQIGFNGAASAELTQLLHAVERQLNGLGTGMLAQMDAQAQTTSTGQPCDPKSTNCSSSSGGGPDAGTVVVIAVVAGAIAGAAAGYAAGKKAAKVKSPNP